MKLLVYGLAGAILALLFVLFVRALPDMAERAKIGEKRTGETNCDMLSPAPGNRALGLLPADAPDFKLRDYSGREYTLSSLKGNVVLVNFWATWCKTCVVEMPSMEKLVDTERKRKRPFRLLAVSVDDDWPAVRNFFPNGTPLEILLDAKRDTPRRYGTEKFPESFIIDKEGKVRYYVVSDRDWNQPSVAACIDSLINNG